MALDRTISENGGRSKYQAAIIGCLLAIAASAGTSGILHSKHRFYAVDSKFDIGMGAPNEARLELAAETARIDRLNAAISLGIGGMLLAIAIAVVANSCCALPLRIIAAVPWGAACGGGAGFLGPLVFDSLMTGESLPSTTTTGIGQAAVFACLGLGMGLLYGTLSRSWKTFGKAPIIGAIAGGLGGLAFPIIATFVMPTQSTGKFIADVSMVRLLWLSVPFAFIGFALPSMSNEPAQPTSDKSANR